MNCLLNCLRGWLPWIGIAALVGALIGALLTVGIVCVPLGGTLGVAGGPAGSIGLTLTCGGVALIALLPWVLLGALIGAALGAGVVTVAAMVACGPGCIGAAMSASFSNVTSVVNTSFPAKSLSCKDATASVAALENELATAIAERDAQEAVVANRRTTVTRALSAVTAALIALAAASLLNPFAIAGAATAVAAAYAALAVAEARVLAEEAKLAGLNARVAALETAVQTAKAALTAICGAEEPGSVADPGTTIGGDNDIPEVVIGTLAGFEHRLK